MTKKISISVSIIVVISVYAFSQQSDEKPSLQELETPTEASLRGLHAVSETTVWASGSQGTFLRSVDGGSTWNHGSIVDSVDFRDIHAFDENSAIMISAGHPALVFKTTDAGETWELKYDNHDERVFFDAIDFWDVDNGIAFSDAIDGQFFMIVTKDGGETWAQLDTPPEALEGEGGFAASGTNMIITPSGEILIGSTAGRLIQSDDFGHTWTWIQSLLESSKPTSGIFSIAANEKTTLMVGGDFNDNDGKIDNAAFMEESGKWHLCLQNPPRGYRSGVALVPETEIAICTGPGGTDISYDSGRNWLALSQVGYHAVSFGKGKSSGWMSGSGGRIAKIRFQ